MCDATEHRVSYEVRSVAPLSAAADRVWLDTEAAAVENASARLGVNLTQVTITLHTNRVSVFALRHLTWKGGERRDSGWRGWFGDRFIGATTPDDIAARAAAAQPQDTERGA